MQIDLRNVSYSYNRSRVDEVRALKGVQASINSGEIVAILGREGSGKSTLLQHLNGLLLPTGGQVLVNGEPLTPHTSAGLRTMVSMVFQYPEHQLFAPTVFDDIAFAARRQSLGESEVEQRVLTAANLVGLDLGIFRDRRPLDLSGGERRRVAIAGALVIQPNLLLLDEPMSGLDPSTRRQFEGTLRYLRAESGVGVVIASHSLEEALPIADRLLVMDEGSVVFDGRPEELLERREDVARWGLRLPVTVRLVDMLRSRGMELPPGLWQVSDVVAAIEEVRALRGPLRLGVGL